MLVWFIYKPTSSVCSTMCPGARKTGTPPDYSHRMIGASSVNPTSACAALCTETPPATGVPGWVMEWNRIGRSHVYFAKCHGDGPEMMKICEVLALLLFAALTPEVV